MQLSYLGAPFHGWQRQPNAVSVQSTIEDALGKVLRQPIAITGAGRTDTGVNARMMMAHFDVDSPIDDPGRVVTSLNTLCGQAIAIERLITVHDEAHARFDATSRTYRYFALRDKSPFLNMLSWRCGSRLDFDRMNEAASHLMSVEDFTSFAKLHSDARTNICHVSEARWMPVPGIPDAWMFVITADRFLRNMVRAVVGTLVDVGRGKLSIDGFDNVVACRDRCSAGTSMPPQALYLWDITYPYHL